MRSFASTTGVLLAVATFLVVGVLTCCGGVAYLSVAGSTAVIEEQERREKAAQPQEIVRSNSTQPAPALAPATASAAPAVPAVSSPPKTDDRADYPNALRRGVIEIVPISAAVKKVALRNQITDANGESEDEQMVIQFTIHNHSETKRIDFLGFTPDFGDPQCSFRDEHDNRYRAITFSFTTEVVGDDSGETIEPGESVSAIVVCEPPIKAAKELTVELDGASVGLRDSKFRWKIDRHEWGG